MKRFLSALLCAVLCLGLLPEATPSARMITFAGITPNTDDAFVGDNITWIVYGHVGFGSYTHTPAVYRNGMHYLNLPSSTDKSFSFIPYQPGVYNLVVDIADIIAQNHIYAYSPPTYVVFRSAPKITKVESQGGTSLKVTWTKVAGATGYILLRSTSKTGTYSKIKTTTATSFINTGLTPGKAYYYKVECYNLIGVTQYISSGYSAIKAGVPMAKPTAPTAKVLSPTSVKVSWSAVTGATGYELWRAAGAAGTYDRVYRGTARSFTNTALKTSKLYCYKVRAYKTIGTTSYYGPLSAYKAVRPQ